MLLLTTPMRILSSPRPSALTQTIIIHTQQRHQQFFFFSAQPSPSHEEEEFDIHPSLPGTGTGTTTPLFHNEKNSSSSHNTHSEAPKIGRLVLIRHGQSEWNVTDPSRNLTARFTGWADIGLTQQGKDQAAAAGRAIQAAVNHDLLPSRDRTIGGTDTFIIPAIDVVFCSLLKRSIDTMNIVLDEIHLAEKVPASTTTRKEKDGLKYQYSIPVVHSWRLNERHYGALVGLSKQGAERLYGRVRLTRWRDSWDVRPPPMPLEMVKRWGREDHCQPVTIVKEGDGGRMCVFDPLQNNKNSLQQTNESVGNGGNSGIKIVEHGGKKRKDQTTTTTTTRATITTPVKNDEKGADDVNFMPPSESLHDTYERFLPLWEQGIAPHLRAGRTVLVVGHANTIRSMLFAIDGEVATKENAKKLKIPSALPLIYELCDDGRSDMEYFEDDVDTDGNHDGTVNEFQVDDAGSYRSRIYRLHGRECSAIVPGNLRVLKPRSATSQNWTGGDELRHHLSGVWVETDETKSFSFCTDLGKEMGEQDIA